MRFRFPTFAGRTESIHDYNGVLVPLEEAHLHSHSARSGRCEFEETSTCEEDEGLMRGSEGLDDDADKDAENEGTGMLQMSAAEYSIEGLRRQVRKGDKGQTLTEYESKTCFPCMFFRVGKK
jgi:hypothetical protein